MQRHFCDTGAKVTWTNGPSFTRGSRRSNMPSPDYYKRKCARLTEQLRDARLARMNAVADANRVSAAAMDRAVLISITRKGAKTFLTFSRNGRLTTIETYATWNDEIYAELFKP